MEQRIILLVGDVFPRSASSFGMSEDSHFKSEKTMVKRSILIGKIAGLISFLIGTILFIVFTFLVKSLMLLQTGIIYILVSFIMNLFILIHLLYQAYVHPQHRLQLLQTCGLMLLNLPIAISYFSFMINFNFNARF